MKLVCVGRNYAKHAEELRNEVPAEPVLFIKPDSAMLPPGHDFYLPDLDSAIHYEAELVVRIDKPAKYVEERFAHRYYSEATIGLDFTARDLQDRLKQKGLPWEKAKAFDGAAYLGKWIATRALKNWPATTFSLQKNGALAQKGDTRQMLHSVDALIAYITRFFTLKTGDLVFTGTPEGVGPLAIGDQLSLFLEGNEVGDLRVR